MLALRTAGPSTQRDTGLSLQVVHSRPRFNVLALGRDQKLGGGKRSKTFGYSVSAPRRRRMSPGPKRFVSVPFQRHKRGIHLPWTRRANGPNRVAEVS
eukprot:scaffold223672_cov14-Prasinocladus_malaysianus.AAC.2